MIRTFDHLLTTGGIDLVRRRHFQIAFSLFCLNNNKEFNLANVLLLRGGGGAVRFFFSSFHLLLAFFPHLPFRFYFYEIPPFLCVVVVAILYGLCRTSCVSRERDGLFIYKEKKGEGRLEIRIGIKSFTRSLFFVILFC